MQVFVGSFRGRGPLGKLLPKATFVSRQSPSGAATEAPDAGADSAEELDTESDDDQMVHDAGRVFLIPIGTCRSYLYQSQTRMQTVIIDDF